MTDPTHPSADARDRLVAGLCWAGVAVYALLAVGAPLIVVPPGWMPEFRSFRPGVLVIKDATILCLCGALFLLAPLRFWAGRLPRLAPVARVALLVVGGFALWMLLAMLFSPSFAVAWASSATAWVLLLAVLLAPFFFQTLTQVRLVLLAMLAAGTIIALGVFWSSFAPGAARGALIEFIYGGDLLRMVEEGDPLIAEIQGGRARMGALGTTGNPEYTGTYLATIVLLAGTWVLTGWGMRFGRSLWGWLLGLAVMGTAGLGVLASGTRGAIVVVFAGLLATWLISWRLRGWAIAAGLAAVLMVGLLLGVVGGAVALILGCALALLWQVRTGQLHPAWHALPLRTRRLVLAAPVALVAVILLALALPPTRVRLMRLQERFSTVDSEDQSVRMRLLFLMIAAQQVADNPIFGVGPGYFAPQYYPALTAIADADGSGAVEFARLSAETWYATSTHNDFFQTAAETGVPGLVLFLGAGCVVLAGCARIQRGRGDTRWSALAGAVAVPLVGYYTMMLTSFPLQEGARLASFSLLLACGVALVNLAPAELSQDSQFDHNSLE